MHTKRIALLLAIFVVSTLYTTEDTTKKRSLVKFKPDSTPPSRAIKDLCINSNCPALTRMLGIPYFSSDNKTEIAEFSLRKGFQTIELRKKTKSRHSLIIVANNNSGKGKRFISIDYEGSQHTKKTFNTHILIPATKNKDLCFLIPSNPMHIVAGGIPIYSNNNKEICNTKRSVNTLVNDTNIFDIFVLLKIDDRIALTCPQTTYNRLTSNTKDHLINHNYKLLHSVVRGYKMLKHEPKIPSHLDLIKNLKNETLPIIPSVIYLVKQLKH